MFIEIIKNLDFFIFYKKNDAFFIIIKILTKIYTKKIKIDEMFYENKKI